MPQHQRRAGSSAIPSRTILNQLNDPEFRDGFVADQVRVRLALLVRSLREQRGWSQAELGRRLGKPQSVVSRLEDPDYGRLSSQTIFEVAAAFGLPVYIDMPDWDEWFRLIKDMSSRNLRRRSFDADYLATLANDNRKPEERVKRMPASAGYVSGATASATQGGGAMELISLMAGFVGASNGPEFAQDALVVTTEPAAIQSDLVDVSLKAGGRVTLPESLCAIVANQPVLIVGMQYA